MNALALAGLSLLSVPVLVAAPPGPAKPLGRTLRLNESKAIGDIRTIAIAEAAYASFNKGYYDTPQCLVAPSRCIPGYRGPSLLEDGELASGAPRNGYTRTFHTGPPAPKTAGQPISPSSMTSFAFVAVPTRPGRSGGRAFCGDATGVICETDGAVPKVVDGVCPSSCVPVG